jgi:hypothetical protein
MVIKKINIKIMKKNLIIILISVIPVIFISCDEESVYTPDEKFVVQAYLYANEPVHDVSIKNAVPLTVADSLGEPINDAIITLFKNNVAYSLVSNSDTGTYFFPGNDLLVETGDVFYIEAAVAGKTASAVTAVPEAPQGVIMSTAVIEFPEIKLDAVSGRPNFTAMQELRTLQRETQLEVIWDNPNNELHFVVIENAESNQVSIFPDFGGNFGKLGARGAFQRITAPTRESSQQINFSEIQFWGSYIVKVYRVNKEYADLYDNLEQDSRDLNEPPTNIENGLGIFSAFNSMNVYFEVEKK